MEYRVISADCHIDLPWLPPDLFTANASKVFKDRMPYVADGEKGPVWVSKNGGYFGLQNGMGSSGREYIPGQIHRSDRMADEGLYEDGKNGTRRLTDPDLRIKDQDRDGIQAEVLFGILGASQRLNDPAVTGVNGHHKERAGPHMARNCRGTGVPTVLDAMCIRIEPRVLR